MVGTSRHRIDVDGLWWHPEHGLPRSPASHTYFPRTSSSLARSLVASGGAQADLAAEQVTAGLMFAGESRVRFLTTNPRVDRDCSSGPIVPSRRILPKVLRAGRIEWSANAQIMAQRASYNYSHFLTEVATSALRWQDEGTLDPDAELVVARMPAAQDVLRLAGISRSVRLVERNTLLILRSAMLLQATPAGFLAPDLIRELARRVRAGVRHQPRGRDAIVYLSHPPGQRRALSNEEEVIEAIRSVVGPVLVVDPTTMRLHEQVAAVRDARVLIGPHGAQLANLIWAEHLESLVELLPYPIFDFERLTSALGVERIAVMGTDAVRRDHEAPLRCEPDDVVTALRGLAGPLRG